LRHTNIGWDLGGEFNYIVTMELIISHHWRLPKAVLIPMLQNRLSHCFQKGLSQTVDIPSLDWASLYGTDLPKSLIDKINKRYETEKIPVQKIRLGNLEVFKVLQKEWYIQKSILFVSNEITQTNLDLAIRFWLHDIELNKTHWITG
jgi:hypothetical protein